MRVMLSEYTSHATQQTQENSVIAHPEQTAIIVLKLAHWTV